MRRLLIFFSLILFVALPASAVGVFPYKYQESVLDNGLKVILVPMKNSGLVSYSTLVHTGSRDEVEAGKSGFAHFFEHMMFRGTKRYPSAVYDKMMAEMGADRNAFTGYDYTCYYTHVPSQYLEKVIDLESDRFMNLKYSLPDFKTEAKAVLGEYNKSLANPLFQLEEKLNDTAFEKSTYKHTVIGFLKDIQNMPNQFDYSLVFFDRFYRPENCTIFITGSFEPANALTLVKKYYSPWKDGNYKTVPPKEPQQTSQKRAKVDYQGDTLPHLAVAYKTPAFDPENKDFASLSLLAQLAFGETSPLYQKLVLVEQKVDLLYVEFYPQRDPFLMTIIARLKKEQDIGAVENSIYSALEEMKNKTVDSRKLAELKSNRKYSFLISMDTSKSIVDGLYVGQAPYVALTRSIAGVDQLFDSYSRITPEDLRSAAAQYLTDKNKTVVSLTGAKQ